MQFYRNIRKTKGEYNKRILHGKRYGKYIYFEFKAFGYLQIETVCVCLCICIEIQIIFNNCAIYCMRMQLNSIRLNNSFELFILNHLSLKHNIVKWIQVRENNKQNVENNIMEFSIEKYKLPIRQLFDVSQRYISSLIIHAKYTRDISIRKKKNCFIKYFYSLH